jgi:hypothetical protein
VIKLRATALVAVASLALHELRYVAGYGSHAHDAIASQGHGYLPFAGAAAVVILAAASAQLLAALARAWRTGAGEGAELPLGLAWLAASLALTGVYTGQELLEGAFASGHPGGIAAVTAHGGLLAYPLAFVLGGLVALALRGARAAVDVVARRASRPSLPRPRVRSPRPLSPLDLTRPAALAGGRSVRGPPLVS